jgi:hypothetical protein
MTELWIVLGLCAALGGLAALWTLEPITLLYAGAWVTALGLAFGVPTGVWYHVALWRSLSARARLPERWWLDPIALHGDIPREDRFRVLAWCYAGAAGFLVTIVGCALVALGAWRGFQIGDW